MIINDPIRELIYDRKSAGVIKKQAIVSGLATLRMDGAKKAAAGVTTIAEVLRVTQADAV